MLEAAGVLMLKALEQELLKSSVDAESLTDGGPNDYEKLTFSGITTWQNSTPHCVLSPIEY